MIIPSHHGQPTQTAGPCKCLCHDPDVQVACSCLGPPCCGRPQVKYARQVIAPAVVKAAATELARRYQGQPWLQRIEWSSRPAMVKLIVKLDQVPNLNTMPREHQGIRVEWVEEHGAGPARRLC